MSILQLAVAQVMTPSFWGDMAAGTPRTSKKKRQHRSVEQFNADRRLKSELSYKNAMGGMSVTVRHVATVRHMHIDAARNAINRLAEDGLVIPDGKIGKAQLWKWVNK